MLFTGYLNLVVYNKQNRRVPEIRNSWSCLIWDSSRATACTTPTFVHQLRLYIDASTSGESSGTRPRALSVAK